MTNIASIRFICLGFNATGKRYERRRGNTPSQGSSFEQLAEIITLNMTACQFPEKFAPQGQERNGQTPRQFVLAWLHSPASECSACSGVARFQVLVLARQSHPSMQLSFACHSRQLLCSERQRGPLTTHQCSVIMPRDFTVGALFLAVFCRLSL